MVSGYANSYAVNPVLTDKNTGERLAAGRDYERKFVYTYGEDVTVKRKMGRNVQSVQVLKGTKVDKEDIIPADTVINVTVAGKNYDDVIQTSYRIVEKTISSARVSFKPDSKLRDGVVYTGQEQFISMDDIVVTVSGETLTADDYEIASYENNIEKGKAIITIHGKGKYGGIKQFKIKIKPKNISN